MTAPRLSVVIATFNRAPLLAQLLDQLASQSLPPDQFEVVVVDDGSTPPARPVLDARQWPFRLLVEEQANAGAAAARHRGVLAARGELIVVVDDDMKVGEGFLAAHLAAHRDGQPRAVLGHVRSPDDPGAMSLHERWHQENLDALARRLLSGGRPLRGNGLYTGNVSFRRPDYLAAGGFDPAYAQAEDAELGLRLEAAGVALSLSGEAWSENGSDHVDAGRWRERSRRYGLYDVRMTRRHPAVRHASPWRFLSQCNPLLRPALLAAGFLPGAARMLAPTAYLLAKAADAIGARRAAHALVTLCFGCDYYRGARPEAGGYRGLHALLVDYLALPDPARPGHRGWPSARFLHAIRRDHEVMRGYDTRYGHPSPSKGSLVADAITRIGFQLMVAVRVMHLLRDWRLGLLAKLQSRINRHLYGSDIHPDAELAPGIMLVHGFGLAVSPAARVGTGCILFQNVCLGMGVDPATRESGAPTLEAGVHVMPGATLTGPIRVGAGSKVTAGAVLTVSVPAGSIVEAARPEIRLRERRGAGARSEPSDPRPPAARA